MKNIPLQRSGGGSCCAPQRGDSTIPPGSDSARAGASGGVSDVSPAGAAACTEGMKLLDGGAFLMGSDSPLSWVADGEGPVREVTLPPFWIDACAVTNAQFEKFVAETGYITEAERFEWAYVFYQHLAPSDLAHARGRAGGAEWWVAVDGASWRHPEGPRSTIRRRASHPVVHVSWNDALAYCRWSGKSLPTEAEWEYAARGGLAQALYPWGDELTPRDERGRPRHRCNIWQGVFPHDNNGEDGYIATAPADAFEPNAFGLYNMSGNVWEWCGDWFSPNFHVNGPRYNPSGPESGSAKVQKGGSFLCHASYCNRYRVAARTSNTPDSATAHCGFRCVIRP